MSSQVEGSVIHYKIVDTARQYIQGASIDRLHTSLGDYARDTQPRGTTEKSESFFEIQAMRIEREALAGALGGVIVGRIAQKALEFSDGERLDDYRMLDGMSPHDAFMQGVSAFLAHGVRTVIAEMTEDGHPHNRLFNFFDQFERRYQSKVSATDHTDRMGAMKADTPSCHQSLVAMFAGNYQHDATSLMICNSIAAQDLFGELPDPSTLMATTLNAHPHWLATATHTRLAWQKLLYGTKRQQRMLKELKLNEYPPSWSNLWQEGFIKAAKGVSDPFEKCPTESPLVYRVPGQTIIAPSRVPRRCSGQLALSAGEEADATLSEMAYLTGSPRTENNTYSPIDLLLMLGRAVSTRVYKNRVCRRALVDAKLARDRAARSSSS